MELNDLSKDLRRLLLEHWTEKEVQEQLKEPEYFFDQVVNPRLEYLKKNGQPAPRKVRFGRNPKGEPKAILIP